MLASFDLTSHGPLPWLTPLLSPIVIIMHRSDHFFAISSSILKLEGCVFFIIFNSILYATSLSAQLFNFWPCFFFFFALEGFFWRFSHFFHFENKSYNLKFRADDKLHKGLNIVIEKKSSALYLQNWRTNCLRKKYAENWIKIHCPYFSSKIWNLTMNSSLIENYHELNVPRIHFTVYMKFHKDKPNNKKLFLKVIFSP